MNTTQTQTENPQPLNLKPGYIALATGVLGTSVASLLYKLSYLTGLHPLWVNAIRLLLTLVLMTPMTLLNRRRREDLRHVSKKGVLISALSGTLLAFHFTAWALALDYTDVFAASAIWGTYLLMTALFSSWLLHEKTSGGALVGMVIATVGVVVCNLGGGFGKLSGNLLALLAALLQALYTLCGRKARAWLDTNTYTSIVYLFTFFWMALILLVFGIQPKGFQPQNILWALCLAVFCTLLGHTMLSASLKYFKAPTVSAVMLITVVTAPLVVFLFLGDVPSSSTLIGGCIILIGLAWYLVAERRDARRTAALADEQQTAEA